MKRLLRMLLILGVVSGCGSKSGDTPSVPDKTTKTPDASAVKHQTTPDVAAIKKHMQPAQLALSDPVVNSIGMVLVPIPEGEFTMGLQNLKNTHPHSVKITKPFYLGAFEVTQGQYEKVTGKNPGSFKGEENLPVEQVSWEDAVEFCRKLSALPAETAAGRAYRLPTEAEWEYACRAGTTTRFSFGDDENKLSEYAWFSENSQKHTHPVGEKKPNAWALYDMHGNVWEWCHDWLDEYPNASVTDPTGPKSGSRRANRGGCWGNDARSCPSGLRWGDRPGFRGGCTGFRVAQVPLPDKKQASEARFETRWHDQAEGGPQKGLPS